MMVKDEEAHMPKVLESLQDVVDEIIVVDTGSKDRTPMIAELYGAKVYHHPWQKNFSLHRNQSIGYATGDWVLIIDADERLVKSPNYRKEDFIQWMKTDVDGADFKAVALIVKDFQQGRCAMTCNSARMFKRGTIQYVNMIHNQPRFEGACVLNHFFFISHHGYDLTPAQMRRKFFRTKGLLFKEMRDNPDNRDVPFYLCQLYGHHGFQDKSRYWGERYLSLRHEIPPERYNSTIFFTMVRNYQETGELEKAENLLKEALADKPNDPDLASAMSDIGAMTKNNALMAEGSRRYLSGFREMSENPAKKGGQFYFSLTDDVLTLNLYRLCIASLEEGMRCWQAVRQRMASAGDELKHELKMNLNVIGLPHLIEEVPELEDVNSQKHRLDIREVTV